MSPLAVLTAIIMGSALTITIGLALVIVVFLALAGDHPRLAREYWGLLRSFALFLTLSLVAGYALVGTLRRRPWLWAAQAATWLVVALIGWHYWPN